jgi:hypothetical protein
MAIVDLNTCIWKDPWYRKLPLKAKILFLFLWTNDHKNIACMYEIDIETIGFYTGLSRKDIVDTLSMLYPKVKYDSGKGLVWVVNFVRHQFMRKQSVSPKIKKAIENCLSQLNGHFFIGEFLKEYQCLNIDYPYSIDTLSGEYPYSPGGGEGKGNNIINNQEVSITPPIVPPKNDEDDFDRFWTVYPRKKSKGQALTTWKKLKKEKRLPDIEIILTAIERLKLSHDWQKEGGGFIPYPSSWLNAMGWLDECEVDIKQPEVIPFEIGCALSILKSAGEPDFVEYCRNKKLNPDEVRQHAAEQF